MTALTLNLSGMRFFAFEHKDDTYIAQKTTVQDFLQFVQANPEGNYELIDGIIIPMSNASPRHGMLSQNISNIIVNHLNAVDSPCFCFTDMQCQIDRFNCPHPDFLIVCNDSIHRHLLQNPTVVGEIHSPNNKDNDFKKLLRYQNCSSIQEIIMIEQDYIQVTVYQRVHHSWITQVYHQGDMIHLRSIDLQINIADIYQRVRFDI